METRIERKNKINFEPTSKLHILGMLIIVLFMHNKIYSQGDKRKIWLYTNAFMNIDIMHPKINLGGEISLNEKGRISFTGNIYYYNWFYEEPTQGFVLDLDYKRDFIKKNLYYSFGLKSGFINYDTDGNYISGDKDDTTSVIYTEQIKIEKFIGELNFKIGHKIEKVKIFYDIFIGAGLRFKNVVPVGKSNPEHKMYKEGILAQDIRDNEGSYLVPVLKLGVLIGFRIK